MTLLIERSDIVALIDFTANIPDSDLNRFILEAQNGMFAYYLGEDLHYELVQNYQDSGNYQNLFDGVVYERNSGQSRFYHGLKPLLIYCFQFVYLSKGQTSSTSSGVVKKLKDNSENLTKEEVGVEISKCYSNISKHYKGFLEYINENSVEFSEWQGEVEFERFKN